MRSLFVFQGITTSRKRLAVILAALGLVLGLTGVANVSAAPSEASGQSSVTALTESLSVAADPIRACGSAPKDKDGSKWGKYFKGNGINIRKSPSTKSTICAQGQKSHIVDFHCWKFGSDGKTWTYLRDATTRYAGWVRDDLLVGNGSNVRC